MTIKQKRSIIWKMSPEEFAELVSVANSVGDVLKAFGLKNQGGNNRTAYQRIIDEGLWSETFKKGLNNNKGRKFGPAPSRIPNEKLFSKNSEHRRSLVRNRVIKDGLIPYKCQICKNNGTWMDGKMSLVLDHINGKNDDHRLDNLRFLCPNCNSQTETFAGRNNKRKNLGSSPSPVARV
jgi:5-methylcytosine-specific restriction endonuclease McrA